MTVILNKYNIARMLFVKVVILFLYLAIAYYYFGYNILGHPHRSVGGGGDPVTYLWYMHWYSYAFANHLNPLITNMIGGPAGYNLTKITSVFGIYLLILPFKLFFSTLTAYNIVFIFTTGLAAWTFFLLCYDLTKAVVPSCIGGYLFGFSTYMLAEMLSHVNLTGGIFLLPLIIWFNILFVQQRIGKSVFVLVNTLCLVLLFAISIEVFATFTACAGFALLLSWLMFKQVRQQFLKQVILLVLSYFIAAMVLSPYLYYFFTDKLFPDFPYGRKDNCNDLLSFIIPTQIIFLKNHGTGLLAEKFYGVGYGEEGGYLGVLLISIAAAFFIKKWRHRNVKFMLILTVVFAFLSLGPVLHIAGIKIITLRPNKFFFNLPLIGASLAVRYSLYTSFVVSLVAAYWLSGKSTIPIKIFKYILAILAIVMLLPSLSTHYRYSYTDLAPVPPLLANSKIKNSILKKDDMVLFMPFEYAPFLDVKKPDGSVRQEFASAASYQFQCNFCFKVYNGYIGEFTKPLGQPTMLHFWRNQLNQVNVSDLKKIIKDNKISVILMLPGKHYTQLHPLIDKLGVPPKFIGGLWVYRLSR